MNTPLGTRQLVLTYGMAVAHPRAMQCHSAAMRCPPMQRRLFLVMSTNDWFLGKVLMATLAFHLPSGRGRPREGFLNALLSSFAEGLGKARRYQALTRKSDAELAALGVRREDLPRFVMFGRSQEKRR
jgi:uncharacterized protein YjiS (DUF1127 family)